MHNTVKQVLEGLPVMNFCKEQEVRLQVKLGKLGYTGVLLQHDKPNSRWLPIGTHSRVWGAEELNASKLELELHAIHEVLNKLKHFTVYCQRLVVQCSDEAKIILRTAPLCTPH